MLQFTEEDTKAQRGYPTGQCHRVLSARLRFKHAWSQRSGACFLLCSQKAWL